ncbi:MAG: hypothetical protein AB1489_10155 [Acidobacteriota bacterium]
MKENPALLAKEKGISSHFYADADQLAASLADHLQQQSSPLGLMMYGRQLPCYIVKIEEFFTPVCYDPPASRQVLLAYDEEDQEWLLLGANWFAGMSDMVLPSHLFIDELDLIIVAVQRLSPEAKVRIYSAVDILPITRSDHMESIMETQLGE